MVQRRVWAFENCPNLMRYFGTFRRTHAMLAAIKAETRSYARRQRTYFRHQLAGEAVALRVTVAAPLWEPAVDLSRETDPWLARVEAFLSGVSA